MARSSLEEDDRLFAVFVRGHFSATPNGSSMLQVVNFMFLPPIQLATDSVCQGRYFYRYQNREDSRTRWGMRTYFIPSKRSNARRGFTIYKNVVEGVTGSTTHRSVTWLEPVVVRVRRHEVERWIAGGTTPYPLLERFKKQAARQGTKIV